MKINTIRLRKMIGWLGMLLPWIDWVLYSKLPPSISYTYYNSQCITPFMVILGSAAILLMSYKGYDLIDDVTLTISGVAGLGICLFPTSNYTTGSRVGTFNLPNNISIILHGVCAIIFFGLLAFNSLFLFTKSSGEMTRNKKARNVIYRVCGIGIVVSFVLNFVFASKGFIHIPGFYWKTWLFEAIALFFFALSFLTKANVYKWLFADEED